MSHPNPIKIYSIVSKGCIFFDNSTVSPKFLGTIVAEINPAFPAHVCISRTDRTYEDGVTPRKIFRKLNVDRVQNQAGEFLTDEGYSLTDVITYINGEANKTDVPTSGSVFPATETMDFTRDETNTSILFSNGDHHGINAVKAVAKDNGKLGLFTVRGDVELYEMDFDKISILGVDPVSTTIDGVVNELNAFFTLSALGGAVTAAPVYTMADGVSSAWSESETHNPTGDGLFGNPNSGTAYHGPRVWTTETINQPGEYFTFEAKNVVAGGGPLLGIGLYSVDDGDLAEIEDDSLSNSGHHGFWFSTWLYNYSGYTAPWTTYGSKSTLSYGPGWSYSGNSPMFRYSDAQLAFRDGDTALFKCGISDDGFVGVWYYDVEVEGRDAGYGARSNDWILLARSANPVPEGEFGLLVKIPTTSGQIMTTPDRFATDPAAPVLTYRYVESPDGVFHYPLFETAEEANYVDLQNGGTGTSHTHTYVDDASGTTWYMPDTGNHMSDSSAPVNTSEITYTSVPTEPDGLYTPPAFSGLDLSRQEGTAVNIQVTPQGAAWSTTVSGLPAGLAFDGYSLIQGTCPQVGSDTTYTITVTRANAFGSSVGTFDLQVTDVAPVQTNDTPWTKALDFSGSSERAQIVSNSTVYNPMMMGGSSQTVSAPSAGKTVSIGYPWATTAVFKIDGNNSNQHIWNCGEGAGSNDDNIYLRTDGARSLWFGWGRDASGGKNEFKVSDYLLTSKWYGVYIGFNGRRLNATDATSTYLPQCFDIRLMHGTFAAPGSNLSTSARWGVSSASTGGRMDRSITGALTLGGRGSNRSFHGKVASFATTTLKNNVDMPDDTEIKEMITDPLGWMATYKEGNSFRRSYYGSGTLNWDTTSLTNKTMGTQIYLMGDGTNDSYSNMIRNQVAPTDQNYTKLNLLSMVSNDIQTVNIPGLT